MTHPLTPREKVELKPCPMCGMTDSTDNATQDAGLNVQPFKSSAGGQAFRVQCACGTSGPSARDGCGAVEKWNRRTALASGSGDHAELVEELRFLQPCEDMAVSGYADVNVGKMSGAAADALEALLAENAALRDRLEQTYAYAEDNGLLHLRATEAERKLAEAAGLLEPFAKFADEEGGYREDDRLAWGLNAADINWGDLRAARTFLSKEAERG